MSRAEYNRDALDRIRAGASWADLGWDEQFYRRVCVNHGLAPVAPKKLAPLATPKPEAADPTPDLSPVEQIRKVQKTIRPDLYKPKGPRRRYAEPHIQIAGTVPETMAAAVRKFAARRGHTLSEGMRLLFTAGLEALDKKRSGAGP